MAETDLQKLIDGMEPHLVPGRFVFVLLPEDGASGIEFLATVREPEGTSAVITAEDADRLQLEYDFVAAWITLRVNSALEAVGLTAAVSRALAEAGISCNVIAGLHHDHLLVPADRAGDALSALQHLSVDRQ